MSKISNSLSKFKLNLKDKVVLTEAATGSYGITAVVAAMAGADVYALAKDSAYGSIEDSKNNVLAMAKKAGVESRITFIESVEEIKGHVDIVTNSGFVRPINRKLIDHLSEKSVITLMYEPWEFREEDIDIEYAYSKKVKVYGTNEGDQRLKTMEYIGLTVLYLLLNKKVSSFSEKNILILGNAKFADPVKRVLTQNSYKTHIVYSYSEKIDVSKYDVIVVAENEKQNILIGHDGAYIATNDLNQDHLVLHICGSVDFSNAKFDFLPENPKPFGYMSYRTDFVDDQALIDLQVGSLSVAEGMLVAGEKNLEGSEYKKFMEANYPALSFENSKYW